MTRNYEVETGVPVPVSVRPTTTAWPWRQMKDGDSILISEEDRKKAQASGAAWLKRQRPGWRAVSRSVTGGKARVWFVAPDESETQDAEPEEAVEAESVEGVTESSPIEDAVEDVEPPAS